MSDTQKEEVKKPLSRAEQLDIEIKEAQLEEAKLSAQEKKFSVQDLKQRLGEREVKELQKKQDREAQGRTFAQQKATDDARQRACTHKKGGVVQPRDMRVLSTGGNGQQFAVIKHQMMNGDIWIRCLRCGKTWKPPVKENFYFSEAGKQVPAHMGVFNREKFVKAVEDYQKARDFETNNTMSGSVQVRFSRFDEASGNFVDAAQDYAATLADTTLR